MSCKWNGRENPRILPGRHLPECPQEAAGADLSAEDGCGGCLPCPEPHCGVCRRTHADVTCAECVAGAREELATIRRICGLLPSEALRNGVRGEAMMLNGPAANAEAWGNRHMSALRGRLCKCATRGHVCPAELPPLQGPICRSCKHPSCVLVKRSWLRMCPDAAAYLEDARDEAHPLWVLGTWENVWRDALDQPSDLRQNVERAADYIDRHLHELAEMDEPDFPQFATELRGCRAHLEAVIHDERQGDAANVGCFECGSKIERKLTERDGFEDVWTCTRCRRTYTYAEYNFALRAELEARKASA